MGSQVFETVCKVLAAHARGGAPDPHDLELLRDAPATTGTQPPSLGAGSSSGAAPAAKPDLAPGRIANADDTELEALFGASGTLGIEKLINSGERRVDPVRGEIYNDSHWKGYLPRGLLLGEFASRIFSGYFKRFWKEGGRFLGETRYVDGRIGLNHALEEVVIERRTNDLEPGRYIVMRYTDPVFEHLFYDVIKVVNDDLVLYRGYTGRYPDGCRGWTAPLLRRYHFPQMDSADHRELFRAGSVPDKQALQGTWRMDLVANANHATNVALLHFTLKPDGTLESRYEAAGRIGGLPMPMFVRRHFRARDFTAFSDELRGIGSDFLVGRFVRDVPGKLLDRFLRTSSLGLFQVDKDGAGDARVGFFYLLNRTR